MSCVHVQQGACARGRWVWTMSTDSSGGIRSLDQIRSLSLSLRFNLSLSSFIISFVHLFSFSPVIPGRRRPVSGSPGVDGSVYRLSPQLLTNLRPRLIKRLLSSARISSPGFNSAPQMKHAGGGGVCIVTMVTGTTAAVRVPVTCAPSCYQSG